MKPHPPPGLDLAERIALLEETVQRQRRGLDYLGEVVQRLIDQQNINRDLVL